MKNNEHELLAIRPVLYEINHEMDRHLKLWGEQNHPDVGPDSLDYMISSTDLWREKWENDRDNLQMNWSVILGEEVAEALDAAEDGDVEALHTELVQVAAVAASWVEALDRRMTKEHNDNDDCSTVADFLSETNTE